MKFALALFLSCFLLISLQLPGKKGYVNDLTNTLTEQETLFMDQQLRSFEAQEGVQLVLIVIPTLEGQTVQTTAQQIASQWQVGHRGRDSGILLLAAKKESKSYIDIGYAMEDNINDKIGQKISKDVIDPLLARGKVYKAVQAGVGEIFAAFGKTIGQTGAVGVGSFWDMTSLIMFLAAIPLLYLTARFASSKHIWLSPALGFITGLTQSISLAVTLACMGGIMVMICYIIRNYLPPKA